MTTKVLEVRRTLWLVTSVTALLFATANLPWHLDDYDQAKQAFTSFQMINFDNTNPSHRGEVRWLYQQTPHQRVATKPPLVAWISAGTFAITRSWDLAWRLPSFLSAIALAIVLFHAANSAYGTSAALIAFSAFGLNLLTPRLATLVRTDMPLTLVIFLIGLLIWQNIRRATQWRPRDPVYLFALLTAAMLIKGPIVYAFLLPGILLFEWWNGRVGALHRPDAAASMKVDDSDRDFCSHGAASPCHESRTERLGTARRLHDVYCTWWPWIASLAIFLLWTIGGIVFQPGFFNDVVMREFGGRFGETIHRPQPFYFYVPHLVHKFFPWSVLMITVAIVDLRSRNWRAVFREMPPETLWLLCWTFGGLILMSLVPSKRVDRIFPVIPPLCLLLAAQLGGHAALCRKRSGFIYRWNAIAVLVAILVVGGYTISKVTTGYVDHRDALAVFGRNVRHAAELRHWRYEVVSALDEGLLLYLRKTHFIEPKDAVAEWNHGDIDALVASIDKAAALVPDLQGAALSDLKSMAQKSDQEKAYVLITR